VKQKGPEILLLKGVSEGEQNEGKGGGRVEKRDETANDHNTSQGVEEERNCPSDGWSPVTGNSGRSRTLPDHAYQKRCLVRPKYCAPEGGGGRRKEKLLHDGVLSGERVRPR